MKTALITGVSRGIGRALAQKFLAEGWRVIGTSQTGNVDYSDPNLKIFDLDLTLPKSIQKCTALVSTWLHEHGYKGIDILIDNAGAMFDEGETHLVVDKLRQTLEVNLIGTADLTERLISFINKGGHIVCLSSQAGSIQDMDRIMDSHEPYHYPAYKISKAALNMYIRTLAVKLNHENFDITVSAIHPGWVRTDMGGSDAPTTPEEASNDIYQLAISRPETGQFWYKGEKYPW
ncbi:MAG: SDR family NAD(P)-dependent oxidoreductase [Patescibacteria group bacterium]|nr:SDR family NAD(P)-dependent oxidoreductase [Patescibacteria group bacterium]